MLQRYIACTCTYFHMCVYITTQLGINAFQQNSLLYLCAYLGGWCILTFPSYFQAYQGFRKSMVRWLFISLVIDLKLLELCALPQREDNSITFFLPMPWFAGLPNLEHVVVIKYIEDSFTDISSIPHRWVALLYPIQSIIT